MNKNEIFNCLVNEISSMLQDKSELKSDSVISTLGLTSIGYVKLLIYSESAFEITFEDEDLLLAEDLTIGDLVNKIFNLMN